MNPKTMPMTKAYLLNRMMFAIAARVRELVGAATGIPVQEVPHVDALPLSEGGLLIVGRQHLSETGELRLGHQVLAAAVDRLRPDAVLYVLPSEFDEWKYDRDLEAIDLVRRRVPVHIVEFPAMRRLSLDAAAAITRRALATSLASGAHPPFRRDWLFSGGADGRTSWVASQALPPDAGT